MAISVGITHIITFKLKQNGISGELLIVLEDFLKDKKQRFVLNRQSPSWV